METTDYVSYPIALALKKAGFDEPCDHVYCKWFLKDTDVELLPKEERDGRHICANAPTLWQAQKWMREKHHMSIRVSYIAYHKVWFADWLNLDSGEFDDTDATFVTYEEALADGISAALELIKKGE